MDCDLQLHLLALHSEPGFEYRVPGVGAYCKHPNFLLGVGSYSNSIQKRSNYVIAGKQLSSFMAVVGGVSTGYIRDITPIGGLLFTYQNHHLMVIPRVPNETPWVIQYSITFK
jgi:hypothetical protein